ncbi:beta-galactosidase-like [Haemaphysalis longicornis]
MASLRLAVFVGLLVAVCSSARTRRRSFRVDFRNNRFLKDGKPFLLVSGSLHYFRLPKQYWRDRMEKMRLAGLNAVQTYVEWSGHEPEQGQFNFDDNYDLRRFLETAMEVGLLVVLRPGPFICAERENGGLPYWLRRVNPQMRVRAADVQFTSAVSNWFDKLFPIVEPYLYHKGGPIIMVQVENEYGQYGACDIEYLRFLRYLARRHLGTNVVLFRTDIPEDKHYKCDQLEGTLVAADFDAKADVQKVFEIVRNAMRRGPLFVAEYWSGWFDNWGKPHSRIDNEKLAETLDEILRNNASVNFYMFFGGTNFGFTNGANPAPVPTSYDYCAPLSEAGDPTDLYFKIREVVGRYLPLPDEPPPEKSPKLRLGTVQLTSCAPLETMLKFFRLRRQMVTVASRRPKSFEELGQAYGYVLYTTRVPFQPRSPAQLSVPGIKNRGYVFTAHTRTVLSTDPPVHNVPIIVQQAGTIAILVENTGRINYGDDMVNMKGILGDVSLDNHVLEYWTMEVLPLSNSSAVRHLTETFAPSSNLSKGWKQDCSTPGAFFGEFVLPEGQPVLDTFLDPMGWGKGVAFVNDFNLGRYWPSLGPQVTLYVPGVLLFPYPKKNTIFLFETESAPTGDRKVIFVDEHNIDGPVPAYKAAT